MSKYRLNKNDAIMTSRSSRGSQIKFYKDGYWYKIDENGPEGLSEYLATIVLKNTGLKEDEYVKYEKCEVEYEGKIYDGCRSRNFLSPDEDFYSYQKLYEMATGSSLSEDVIPLNDPKERIDFVVNFIKDFIGLDVREHISKVATLDMLILNTDRHFNNIGVIMDRNGENAKNSPIFDNGAGFLSDYTKTPPDMPVSDIDVHTNIFGKPFSPDLEYQAVSAGLGIRFDFEKIKDELRKMPDVLKTRPGQILIHQIKAYENVLGLNKTII